MAPGALPARTAVCLLGEACQVLSRFAAVPSLPTRVCVVRGRSSLTPRAPNSVRARCRSWRRWPLAGRAVGGVRTHADRAARMSRRSVRLDPTIPPEKTMSAEPRAVDQLGGPVNRPGNQPRQAAAAQKVEDLEPNETADAAEDQPVPKAYLYARSAVLMPSSARSSCAPLP